MKGGQLVRGAQCVKQRVFINFCHLNTEYCISCLLTKLGGGGSQTPQDSTPTWDHGCTLMLMSSCIWVQTCPRITRQGRKVPLAVPTTILVKQVHYKY